MIPDNDLERQEEEAIEDLEIRDALGEVIAKDVTDLSDEELVETSEIEGDEELDETLSERFIEEVQAEAVQSKPVLKLTGMPQTGESLDDFITRKEQAHKEGKKKEKEAPQARATGTSIKTGKYTFTLKK